MISFARSEALPTAFALALVPLLLGSLGLPAGAPSAGTPSVATGPAIDTGEDPAACQFAILAHNTLSEDVWILFSESRVTNRRTNFFTTRIRDTQDRRLEPGERLNTRYEAPGACGAPRFWEIRTRIGSRGGERIAVDRATEGPNDRTLDLGDAACWATAGPTTREGVDRLISIDGDAFGCDAEADADADGRTEPPPTNPEPRGARLFDGDWIRVESNYPPNDGMRIRVERGQATVSSTPPGGVFSVGQTLWRDVTSDGNLDVLGNDGAYYPSAITRDGADRLYLDVDRANSPGNDQVWQRAGPSIDGEWILATTDDLVRKGLRVQVEGERATLRYVPPAASRELRVGEILWKEIGAGERSDRGRLQALRDARTFAPLEFNLVGDDHLRLVSNAGGAVEIWARPGAPELSLDLEGEGADSACLASSLRHDRADVSWGWGLGVDPPPTPRLESTVSSWPSASRRNYEIASTLPRFGGVNEGADMVIDVDRSHAAGMDDHPSYVWQANPDGRAWRSHVDLTAAELDAQVASYRDRGYRLLDLEAYTSPAGVQYAGTWIENREAVEWLSDFDLTSDEYGTVYRERREAGYRLVDVEAHATLEGMRYAGIWYRSCDGTNWRQWRHMTRTQYQARLDSLAELDLQVVDFESYRTSGGQRYAAIWEEIPASRAWRVRSGRTLRRFLDYHRRYSDEGFRLVDYESYATEEGVRYAGVWGENARRYDYTAKAAITDTIEAYLARQDLPGMSVVVIQDGDVVYQRGFGLADVATDKWAHARTVYLTASVSKVIGATLAARLEDRGEGGLDLSRSTSEYLDGGEAMAATCQVTPSLWFCDGLPDHHTHTLEQLLSKTACVHHYPEGAEPDESRFYSRRVEALAQIWSDSLLPGCTPGRNYRYSTHGFTYVGAVLEAVTGKDLAQLLDDEIARPFGLPSLRAMYSDDGNSGFPSSFDRASAYTLTDTDSLPGPANPTLPIDYRPNASWKVLGGGIESHALDLARFGWKLLDGEIMSGAARDGRMWTSLTDSAMAWIDTSQTPQDTFPVPSGGVGMAWNLAGSIGSGNGRTVRHGGDANGAGSYLKIWRDRDLVIAMLSNRRYHSVPSGAARNTLMNRLADLVLAATPP